MKELFSEADLERVRQAVADAERRTSGEIVPYIVPQSSRYEAATWRAASVVAVIVMGIALLVMQFYEGWGLSWLYASWGIALLVLAAGSLGAVAAAFVPLVTRFFAGATLLDRTVHQRALQAFIEEEVFSTRDRTGILLFISLLEHRIEVLGDEGINRHVGPEVWADVVLRIRDGIKEGNLADGLVEAVEMCGALLEQHGVALRPDDINELSDDIRFRSDPN